MTHGPNHQSGVALVIALILLLAMTVIAFAASRDSLFQVRMSDNLRQKQVAFQSSEVALRGGESWLFGRMGTGKPAATAFSACSGCNILQSGSSVDPFTINWKNNVKTRNGPDLANQANGLDVAERPRFYIVEQQSTPLNPMVGDGRARTLQYYQLSAHASGRDERVESIVQSTFKLLY